LEGNKGYKKEYMNLKGFFDKAYNEKWAIGHFNFSTLEHFLAISEAAEELKSPVILATSRGEADFVGIDTAVFLTKSAKERGIKIFLHLDHGKDLDFIKKAVNCGYDSVHFDGSSLPFEDNLKLSKKVVEYAKDRGVFVEGEIGVIPGESSEFESRLDSKKGSFTDPIRVREFVEKTKLDSLAVSVGNIHGIYKEMPDIDYDLIDEIKGNTKIPLVFHGGSGFSDKEIRRVVEKGFQKINVNTLLRKTWKESLQKSLSSESIKPYQLLDPVKKEIKKEVKRYIKLLGSENK
jgi:ketose-bisphosphate aldolase